MCGFEGMYCLMGERPLYATMASSSVRCCDGAQCAAKECFSLAARERTCGSGSRSSSVLVRRDYSEEAKELLEAVAAEERSDERMAEGLAPVHLRARQTVRCP